MNEIYTERHASAANLSDVFSGNERKTFTTAAHTDKHTHTHWRDLQKQCLNGKRTDSTKSM